MDPFGRYNLRTLAEIGTRWTCPACGRTFGRSAQGHLCIPVRPLDDFLASQPAGLRAVFEAVVDHMRPLPDVIIEPGDAYLMLKRSRKFAALISRRKWVRMWLILPFAVHDYRIQSRTGATDHGVAHFLQLREPSDVDGAVRGWLTEAYESF